MTELNSSNEGIRVEFAVNVKDEDELSKLNDILTNIKGIKLISSDSINKTIQLEIGQENKLEKSNSRNDHDDQATSNKNCCTVDANELTRSKHDSSQNVQAIQKLIETQTGIVTVVKGLGSYQAAVAELRPPCGTLENETLLKGVIGVIRMSQMSSGKCFVDGLLDGFKMSDFKEGKKCSLAIHQYGDMNDLENASIGKPIIHIDSCENEQFDSDSRYPVQKIISNCDVASMIGRSLAVTQYCDNDVRRILSAGVIARAATVDANKKQICSCSGKTIWEERLDKQKMQ